jgi:acetyl esterase
MIDPQAEAARAAFNAGPPLDQIGVEQARRWLAEARARRTTRTPVALVEDASTGRVGVRLYHPQPRRAAPVIVYAHGGGWVVGSIDTADEACRRLAHASQCAVVSVEYRLAPEARNPAPIEDVLEVLRFIPESANFWRLDPRSLAIAGESSGAHTAISAALLAPSSSVPPVTALLLVCPALDRHLSTQSWAAYGDDYVPRRSQMAWMWNLYLGEHDEYLDGAPNPATADLHGLPPTLLVVAEYDPLRDEGLHFARRLQAAGTPVDVIDCAGQIHPVFAHAPAVAACDHYLRRAGRALAALLARED